MNTPPIQRLPKAIAGLGIVLIGLGIIMALGAMLRTSNPLPLVILAVFTVSFGIWAVAFYKNSFIIVRPDFIQQRTTTGKLKTIKFTDIVWHNGHRLSQNTVIRSADGTKIKFSTAVTEATSLHAYLRGMRTWQ